MMPVTEFDIRQGLTYSHQPTSQTARQPHLFSEVRQNFFFHQKRKVESNFLFSKVRVRKTIVAQWSNGAKEKLKKAVKRISNDKLLDLR